MPGLSHIFYLIIWWLFGEEHKSRRLSIRSLLFLTMKSRVFHYEVSHYSSLYFLFLILWSLLFLNIKSPVSHYGVSRFSLRSLLLLVMKSPVSHYEASCFSLWSFSFFIMKSPVTHYEIFCFSSWILLFFIIRPPVSNYEVSCFSLWSFLLPGQNCLSQRPVLQIPQLTRILFPKLNQPSCKFT